MKRLIHVRGVYGLESSSSGGMGILLNGQMIESILYPPFPPGIPSIDAGNCMIAHLFTDYHLHFFKKSIGDSGHVAEVLFRAGIGTVYEGGDRHMNGLEMKERLKGKIDVKCAGSAISAQGGYGANLGIDVRTVEEAKRTIEGLILREVDYIKIINSGIFLPETGMISPGGWDARSLAKIISCAKERGLAVFCHANGDDAIRDAVHAGAAMVIHGFFVSRDTLCLMQDHDVALVPTIAALSGLLSIVNDSAGKAKLRDMVNHHIETVASALSIGVRVLPGSDAGTSLLPYGEMFTEELYFLTRAGMPEESIIKAASCGSLLSGMHADFLILDGLKVKKVFLKGEIVFEGNE